MTCGRARDDTWKGGRHVEGRATMRAGACSDAWMGVTTRDKGGEGCRDASQDDEQRDP